MDSELKAFLSSRQNLSLAWDISDAFDEMREHVYLTFWKNVWLMLENYLQEKEYTDKWSITFDDKDCSGLLIQPKDLSESSYAFGVGAESLNGEPYGACYYGIKRGKDVKRDSWINADTEISKELGVDGFRSTKWWLGWKYVSNVGLPEMDGEEKEELLDLNDDNCQESHPLAERASTVIFELFEKYRLRLEKLNESYPY